MAITVLRSSQVAQLRRVAVPRIDMSLALALIPTAIILGLLGLVAWISFQESVADAVFTFRHYVRLYTDPFAYQTFVNTVGFAVVTLLVSFLFGVPAAWLVERTDLRGRHIVLAAMTLGVLVPTFFTAMGWLFLLHPRIGTVNQLLQASLGFPNAPIDIVSVPGMGWVQGLSLASLVFVMVASSLRAMDASLEESARTSGAGFVATIWRITLPLAFPSLVASAIYVLTIGISAFDVPAIIGLSSRLFTFSTYLYIQTHPLEGLPEYGLPAAFSTFMVLLALALSWWYGRILAQARKYQVITGRNYKPRRIALRRWAIVAWLFLGAYLLLAKIVPFLLLVWAAALPYLQPPSMDALALVSFRNFLTLPWPLIERGITNTLILVLLAPALALLLSLVFSWVILRSRYRFRQVFDLAAFLPHAVPPVIFGMGALLAALFVIRGPVDLYGTLALLLIVYAVVHVSFGTRVTNAALMQIHQELEEAAYVSGASTLTVVRRVVGPLLRPAFTYAWLWLGLLTFRELTLATMLFSPDNITLPVVVWNLWNSGKLAQASAVTLVLMCLLLPLIALYWRWHFSDASRIRV